MSTITLIGLWTLGLGLTCYHRVSLKIATGLIAAGLVATTVFSGLGLMVAVTLWAVFLVPAIILNHTPYRKRFVSVPTFKFVKSTLPEMSETEKTALEAGSTWWEKELFSGNPNWEVLKAQPRPKLNQEESIFLERTVETLCSMVDDWDTTQNTKDLSPEIWKFIKEEGFFGLIIPKEYGGKEFSAFAHSEILTKLSSHSLTIATTVSVPNSLGPAELLMHYGTTTQKEYYLPRLAKGEEIPCFALTGPDAGSDAGSIPDKGVVCYDKYKGQEVLGIRLNWDKRYITLAPIATVLGLAFKLYDPEHILGDKVSMGITCALIPTTTEGVVIGNRHLPIGTPFQNGPTQGKNVFIPIDWIIGGPKMAGHGWRMLVECLSAGRAISLPSCTSGCAKMGAFSAGAYSRVRRQFGTPIGEFEGVQEALGRICGLTYISESTRSVTAQAIDQGEKPTVPGAISKYHVTENNRKILIDAMDIHGGKAIMLGPLNYLANAFQGTPIAITVEGANILTRNMIIFGQGAIRCHPFILKEMESAKIDDLIGFDMFLMSHVGYTISNIARSITHGLTGSLLANSPYEDETKRLYQQITRASAAFAVVADISMLMLGGKLKFRENISARLGDLLSMMYLSSCALKHFRDQDSPQSDLPILRWSVEHCMAQFWDQMEEIIRNYPSKIVGAILKQVVMPIGLRNKKPKDSLTKVLANILSTENASRDRLLKGLYIGKDEENLAVLERAFHLSLEAEPILNRIQKAVKRKEIAKGSFSENLVAAKTMHIISDHEEKLLLDMEIYKNKVIKVDDFDMSSQSRNKDECSNEIDHQIKEAQEEVNL
jgi:acyl-CoA dehydrogenase